MKTSVKEIIRRRKSIRTYNGKALRSDDRQKNACAVRKENELYL